MNVRNALVVGGLFLSLQLASTAHADEAAIREADARFEEGVGLARSGKYEEARAKFVQSLALAHSPKTLLNLVIAEKNSAHPLEAIRHLRAYLRDPNANPSKIDDLRTKLLSDLYAQTAHIAVQAPAGSSVQVDGDPLPSLDEEFDVAPGHHRVEAKIDGQVHVQGVDAPLGGMGRVVFDLSRPSTEPAPARAEIAQGEIPVQGWWTPRRATGVGIAGLGLVLGVGGYWLFSSAASSDADQGNSLKGGLGGSPGACVGSASPSCAALADTAKSRASNLDRATVSLILGGGMVLTGALLVLWPRRSAPAAATRVLPVVGKEMQGVFVRTHF